MTGRRTSMEELLDDADRLAGQLRDMVARLERFFAYLTADGEGAESRVEDTHAKP